jgi:hypothetical protein
VISALSASVFSLRFIVHHKFLVPIRKKKFLVKWGNSPVKYVMNIPLASHAFTIYTYLHSEASQGLDSFLQRLAGISQMPGVFLQRLWDRSQRLAEVSQLLGNGLRELGNYIQRLGNDSQGLADGSLKRRRTGYVKSQRLHSRTLGEIQQISVS